MIRNSKTNIGISAVDTAGQGITPFILSFCVFVKCKKKMAKRQNANKSFCFVVQVLLYHNQTKCQYLNKKFFHFEWKFIMSHLLYSGFVIL